MASELGGFLRARRGRVSPEHRGLPGGGKRRVAGLRREEIALLAGVSVDYYIRLEQGRADNVSENVLNAVARVLGLDDTERAHLFSLARPDRERAHPAAQVVRPELARLLESMTQVPAFVTGRWQEVIYANRLSIALLPPVGEDGRRNIARHVFLSTSAIEYYADWDEVAADAVGAIRRESGKHPGDPRLAALIGELSVSSVAFARLWAHHDVRRRTSGTKHIRHPEVGELLLHYETMTLPDDDDDQCLVTYSPQDEATSQRLTLLGSLHATDRPQDRAVSAPRENLPWQNDPRG